MTPTEMLKQEHQIILLVLQAARAEAQRIQRTGSFDRARVNKMVDFLRNFVDKCHHAKEEKHLFVRMQNRIPQADGPVSVMLYEHDEGRSRVAALAGAAERTGSEQQVRGLLLEYAALLEQHIFKEDNILYPLADDNLTEKDQQELADAFERIEKEEMGEGFHERYHRLADELAGG